jgi:hypothetical protein
MAETSWWLPESRFALASDTIMVVSHLWLADHYGRLPGALGSRGNELANALACQRPHWMARLPDDVQ